eukprot:2723029-Prymnesium_polylepis.1
MPSTRSHGPHTPAHTRRAAVAPRAPWAPPFPFSARAACQCLLLRCICRPSALPRGVRDPRAIASPGLNYGINVRMWYALRTMCPAGDALRATCPAKALRAMSLPG